MNTILSRVLCVGLAFGLCACYTVHLQNMSGPSTSMGPSSGASLGHFDETTHAHFLIYGLINVGTPDISQMIRDEVTNKGGSAVDGLQLTTTHTFVDGLVNMITLGIYNPVTVELEGDVIK